MDTTLSSKVPGTVVPYVIYLASKNYIKLRAGPSILKKYGGMYVQHISVYNILDFVCAFNTAELCDRLERPRHCLIKRP